MAVFVFGSPTPIKLLLLGGIYMFDKYHSLKRLFHSSVHGTATDCEP